MSRDCCVALPRCAIGLFAVYYIDQPGEHSGSVVESLTRDQRDLGLSLTRVSVLCPCGRYIKPSLVLVQPRKTCPDITEKLLTET